jgi:hypothetical protein
MCVSTRLRKSLSSLVSLRSGSAAIVPFLLDIGEGGAVFTG